MLKKTSQGNLYAQKTFTPTRKVEEFNDLRSLRQLLKLLYAEIDLNALISFGINQL